MHYQILIKKFSLTHNRSLDGVLQKLNSKYLKEGEKNDLGEDFEESDEDKDKSLIGNLPGIIKKKKFPPIKILSVKFSNTNRSFAVATTEGIFIYSLDTSFSFSPLQLEINVTTTDAIEAFNDKSYLKALVLSIYLNKTDLTSKFIHSIPYDQIIMIANKIPNNIVSPLLDFLSKKLESDRQIQLYLMYIFVN